MAEDDYLFEFGKEEEDENLDDELDFEVIANISASFNI